jgi:thioredoxin-related protein
MLNKILMRTLLLIYFSLLVLGTSAQPSKTEKNSLIKWYTFEEAIKLNEKTPRKIIVDVYTDWCSWCKVMDEKTFSNTVIADYINKNYYPVKFNAESKEPITFKGTKFENKGEGRRATHDLAIALLQGKMSYPSIAYLDESNQLLTAVPGYLTPDQIEPILVFFGENHFKTKKWEEFSVGFKGKVVKQ